MRLNRSSGIARTPCEEYAKSKMADFGLAREDVGSDAQSQFDQFYNAAYQLLDAFYPECTIRLL